MKKQTLSYRDGAESQATVFAAEGPSAPLILVLPALGMRASYYLPLGEALQAAGFSAVLTDWRGHGRSSVRISPKVDFGYEQLIQDIRDMLVQIGDWFPEATRYILGHSLGGQLGSLTAARYPKLIDGLILSAAASVYYRGFGRIRAAQIIWASYFIPAISRLVGYFPGHRLGFGGKEARTLMQDWARNARSGEYRPAGSDFDYEAALRTCVKPILALTYVGDNFASYRGMQNLYEKFNVESPVRHLHLSVEDTGIPDLNHFNWARQPGKIVDLVVAWVAEGS